MFASLYFNNNIFDKTVDFFSVDSESNSNRNPDWTEEFNYRFNSLGFRSQEVTDIENSVVIFGCSNAMGVGIPEEKRFGELIAKELNLVSYNFATAGSDFAWVAHNIFVFIHECLQKKQFPKHIIVFWPEIARFSWMGKDMQLRYIVETELPNKVSVDSWQEQFIVNWESKVAIIYLLQCLRSIDLLCKSNNINLLQQLSNKIYFNNDIESLKFCPEIFNPFKSGTVRWDQARDIHAGPITHRKIADSYLKFII